MIALAFLAQAAAGPALPALPRTHSARPCPPITDTSEVVVCGRANDTYRLKPLPRRAEQAALPKAELHLGNAALAAEAEQATLAGGQQSQRLVLRLKLPIGSRKK